MKNTINNYIRNHNGGTFNKALKIMQFNNGFMVSLKDTETTTDSLEKAVEYAKQYTKHINSNQYVGVWLNEEDNLYYIDISVNVLERKEAIAFGRKNAQKAIFDNKYKKCINLVKTEE